MKKILILALLGMTTTSLLNARNLGTPVVQTATAYRAIHVRNSVVNQGGAIKFNWHEPHVNSTNLGCTLSVRNIDMHGHSHTVYTSHNRHGNRVIHNVKPYKYIIDFRCHYKFIGTKSDTKTVRVRPMATIDSNAQQFLDNH